MVKQSAEEIRKEVLAEDDKKDVSIYLSIPVGVVAGVAALGGVCAVIMMRALEYFREEVGAYWLSCVPFIFPVVTGLFAAYKKQFALMGVHLALLLLSLLMGGFGFALSVKPIFIDRHICVPVNSGVSCNRATLSYLYLITGSLAAGFTLLGFILTVSGLYSATKRIGMREYAAHMHHLHEQKEQQKAIHKLKLQNETKPRTLSASSSSHPPHSPSAAEPNGIAKGTPNGPPTTGGVLTQDNATTRL